MSKVRGKRRKLGSEFKAKVAVAAIKEEKTISELGAQFEVHPMQVVTWKKQALSEMHRLFEKGEAQKSEENKVEDLYVKIGRLEMENDYLQKKLGIVR
jgi:transposase